jgi:hypothetical protein
LKPKVSGWCLQLRLLSLLPQLSDGGIVLKYRLRPSFDSETTFALDANEVVVTGLGSGHFPWTVYRRAIRFSDGILLTRPGAIRWLPDAAITQGTAAEALTIIHKKMPLRDLST